MEEATSVKELNAVLVGSKSSQKYLVGNIILGKKAFDTGDVTSCCERREGEVCGRRVRLVKAPGWLRGYSVCNTSQLFKTEAILSVTPGLHGFILVINAELPFKSNYKRATKEHLQHYFGDNVWDHTIVVFIHRGHLRHKTIEDYIRKEGAPLQLLLEDCGGRYHVFCGDGTGDKIKVRELFEKIDTMVAENSCYETDNVLMQSVELKRKEVVRKAEQLQLQTQQQREKLRNLLTESAPNLRILIVGWVFSGKSACGNNILGADVFHSSTRTVTASVQSGVVSGRKVIVVDAPGWWKFFPAIFTPLSVKSEILKGVSLSPPSPNVILLAVPVDTSFTDEQKRVTEGNMKLLGQRVWRHVIVLFTFGDTLGDKTIEQHIESEGKPLRWLIEKCENRYHVLNNTIAAEDQITELLEKMEEMVAGNSSFFVSAHGETDAPQPVEDSWYKSTETKDDNTTREITEKIISKWNSKSWKSHHSLDGLPPYVSDDELKSEPSEEKMNHQHDQLESEDDAEADPLNRWMRLLEREWSRREVSMELGSRTFFYTPVFEDRYASSEPSTGERQRAEEKVTKWLDTQHSTSGYRTASPNSCKSEEENENEKRKEAL